MTRRWIGVVAAAGDVIPLPLLVALLFLVAIVAGALWYFFPSWIPRRMPRFGSRRGRRLGRRWPKFRWRFNWRFWRWRRRKHEEAAGQPESDRVADDELPDVPAEALLSLADRLAASGRYAEAVRERLRAIVRDLIDRQVIDHRPGWTVTELARAAADARPGVGQPLDVAAGLFSDIWYGQRPAGAHDDQRMRNLGEGVQEALDERAGAAR